MKPKIPFFSNEAAPFSACRAFPTQQIPFSNDHTGRSKFPPPANGVKLRTSTGDTGQEGSSR